MTDFAITQGSTFPVLAVTLTSYDGTPVDLTGSTVVFRMRKRGTQTTVISSAATIVSAPGGTVRYTWQAADTLTSGLYDGEFVVTTGAAVHSYPTDDAISIEIRPNLAVDITDEAYTFLFASATEAKEIAGSDISLQALSLAHVTIEILSDMPASLLPVDISSRDRYWLKVATAFQARWLEAHPDYLERVELTEGIHDGAQETYVRDTLIVAPMAKRAISRLSWVRSRSVTIRWPRIGTLYSDYEDADLDWKPVT